MGVLRLMGRSSILENNIVATGASAASSIAAGTIFTIPALVIMGHWTHFDYWWVLAIAGLGGLLGVLFSVPLRRTLILDQELQFPEGVATAEVLKVGQDPGRGLKALVARGRRGALFKLALSGLQALAGVLRRRALLRRAHDRLLRHQPVARAARRRLHRRVQHRLPDALGRRAVLVGVHPLLQHLHDRPRTRRSPRSSSGSRPRTRPT